MSKKNGPHKFTRYKSIGSLTSRLSLRLGVDQQASSSSNRGKVDISTPDSPTVGFFLKAGY